MIKNRILYVIIVAYSALLAILYNVYTMFLVFLAIAGLPIAIFVLLIAVRNKVSVEITPELLVVNRGNKMILSVLVKNQSILPIGYIEIVITAKNQFAKQISKRRLQCFVNGKSQQLLSVDFSSSHCGNIEITCNNIRLYDYLRIFSLKKAVKQSFVISVLPEIYEIESEIKTNPLAAVSDSDVFSKVKSGDDSSEVFGLREYQYGDKLHRIHWKLSSKKDQLMVKEYSLPISCAVNILVEFCFGGKEKEKLSIMDGLLETTFSLSYALVQSECLHYISWYDKSADEFRQADITCEEDIFMAMEEMYDVRFYTEKEKAIQLFEVFCNREKLTDLYYVGTEVSPDQTERLREACQGSELHVLRIETEGAKEKLMKEYMEELPIHFTSFALTNLKSGLEAYEL